MSVPQTGASDAQSLQAAAASRDARPRPACTGTALATFERQVLVFPLFVGADLYGMLVNELDGNYLSDVSTVAFQLSVSLSRLHAAFAGLVEGRQTASRPSSGRRYFR